MILEVFKGRTLEQQAGELASRMCLMLDEVSSEHRQVSYIL